ASAEEEDAAADVQETTFPSCLAPLLARVVQGSSWPLPQLSREAHLLMLRLVPELTMGLTAATVAEKISLVAERKCYGVQPRKAVIPEDDSEVAMWTWEVLLTDLLPSDKVNAVKAVRKGRTNAGKLVKALVKLIEVMTRHPNDAAKVSKEEEKVLDFARKAEALRLKSEAAHQRAVLKEEEREAKERGRREREEAKEEEKRRRHEAKEAKAEERRLKAEEEKKKAEEAVIGKVSLLNFFKVADTITQGK
ncbi:unnamed protein product, partial [Discosporangium mesarthrocarpum]